jgi:hypothetical protein
MRNLQVYLSNTHYTLTHTQLLNSVVIVIERQQQTHHHHHHHHRQSDTKLKRAPLPDFTIREGTARSFLFIVCHLQTLTHTHASGA